MRGDWELEALIACWTLDEADWRLLANKAGATRLGFALLLKFFELEGRFPRGPGELPSPAIEYVAGLVDVPAVELRRYDWSGRTIEYHRAQIRAELGFREATGGDERLMAEWLAGELCPLSSTRSGCAMICWLVSGSRGSSRRAPPGLIGSSGPPARCSSGS